MLSFDTEVPSTPYTVLNIIGALAQYGTLSEFLFFMWCWALMRPPTLDYFPSSMVWAHFWPAWDSRWHHRMRRVLLEERSCCQIGCAGLKLWASRQWGVPGAALHIFAASDSSHPPLRLPFNHTEMYTPPWRHSNILPQISVKYMHQLSACVHYPLHSRIPINYDHNVTICAARLWGDPTKPTQAIFPVTYVVVPHAPSITGVWLFHQLCSDGYRATGWSTGKCAWSCGQESLGG